MCPVTHSRRQGGRRTLSAALGAYSCRPKKSRNSSNARSHRYRKTCYVTPKQLHDAVGAIVEMVKNYYAMFTTTRTNVSHLRGIPDSVEIPRRAPTSPSEMSPGRRGPARLERSTGSRVSVSIESNLESTVIPSRIQRVPSAQPVPSSRNLRVGFDAARARRNVAVRTSEFIVKLAPLDFADMRAYYGGNKIKSVAFCSCTVRPIVDSNVVAIELYFATRIGGASTSAVGWWVSRWGGCDQFVNNMLPNRG
jgi:hypothetical protein